MKKLLRNCGGYDIPYCESSFDGTAVFFIHGNSAGKEIYEKQLNGAPGTKFKCIAFDLLGCGGLADKNYSESELTFKNIIRVLFEFILSFDFKNYYIVAHSLGGHLILEGAQHLKGCKALFFSGVAPIGQSENAESPFTNNPCINLLFQQHLNDIDTNNLLNCLIRPEQKERTIISDLLKQSNPLFRKALANAFAAGEIANEVKLFNSLNIPVYMVHCSDEKLINYNYLKQFEENCWENKINVFENCMHYSCLEDSEKFNAELIRFINQVSN
ncbi:alpha/beta hydrolase [soil metagenome]